MPVRKRHRTSFGSCLQRFTATTDFQSNIIQLPEGRIKRLTGLSCSIIVADPVLWNQVFLGRIVVVRGNVDVEGFYDPFLLQQGSNLDLTDFDILYDANYTLAGVTNFSIGTGIEVGAEDIMSIIQTPAYIAAGIATPNKGSIYECIARLNAHGITFDSFSSGRPSVDLGLR